ncbi:MAG: hypothetical protein K2G26_02070, partial [Clostridia bacterium]|nr:hypothetical protein [Clostridia bacterium]
MWEYSADGVNWTEMTASNKPSYTGDAITVRVSPNYYAGLGLAASDYSENYNSTNISTEQGTKTSEVYITVNNQNYTTATGNIATVQLNWEITARALPYTWSGTQTLEVGDNAFEIPVIKFDDGNDYSNYFDYVYTVNGNELTLAQLRDYIADNWSITAPVSGTVSVRMKDGVTEVNIASGTYPFSTGAPKTAINADVSGSGAEYGLVDFALSVTKGISDERARTTVEVSGGTLAQAKTFDGNDPELVTFVNGLDVGNYVITVSLKAGNEVSYVLTKSVFDFEIVTRKIIVPQVTGEITFNGEYINIVDYLDGNYNADIMSMLSGYTNKTAGAYTVTFKL